MSRSPSPDPFYTKEQYERAYRRRRERSDAILAHVRDELLREYPQVADRIFEECGRLRALGAKRHPAWREQCLSALVQSYREVVIDAVQRSFATQEDTSICDAEPISFVLEKSLQNGCRRFYTPLELGLSQHIDDLMHAVLGGVENALIAPRFYEGKRGCKLAPEVECARIADLLSRMHGKFLRRCRELGG